jgi:hypothetical protein
MSLLGLLLLQLAGCASTPALDSIRAGDTLSIAVRSVAVAPDALSITNESLGKDTGTGAKSGALTGGLLGLTCGPFVFLCLPIGAAIGGVTGTAVGAVVGVTGALSSDQVDRLRQRMARLRNSHDLAGELRQQISDRAARHWTLGAGATTTVLSAELQEMSFSSTRDDRVALTLHVRVRVTGPGSVATGRSREKVFEHVGPYSPLAVWLDEGSDFVDSSLSSASQQLAAQIVAELVPR